MAYHGDKLPWTNLASSFEFVVASQSNDGVTNLYHVLGSESEERLQSFAKAFANAIQEESTSERRKYPETYDSLNGDDIVLSDEVTRRILPMMFERRIDWSCYCMKKNPEKFINDGTLCNHEGQLKCECPLQYELRRLSSFLRRDYYAEDCCALTEASGAGWEALQIFEELILENEMDALFRICSQPFNDCLAWRSIGYCACESGAEGWQQVYMISLHIYLCLNLLYCFPELCDPDLGRTRDPDYRQTKAYQEVFRDMIYSYLQHREFFGIWETKDTIWPEQKAFSSDELDGRGRGRKKRQEPGTVDFEHFLRSETHQWKPYFEGEYTLEDVLSALKVQGLPMELGLLVVEFAEYTKKSYLTVPHDPLHPLNRPKLEKYLDYCWKLMIRCDMVVNALGDKIRWDDLVGDWIQSLSW